MASINRVLEAFVPMSTGLKATKSDIKTVKNNLPALIKAAKSDPRTMTMMQSPQQVKTCFMSMYAQLRNDSGMAEKKINWLKDVEGAMMYEAKKDLQNENNKKIKTLTSQLSSLETKLKACTKDKEKCESAINVIKPKLSFYKNEMSNCSSEDFASKGKQLIQNEIKSCQNEHPAKLHNIEKQISCKESYKKEAEALTESKAFKGKIQDIALIKSAINGSKNDLNYITGDRYVMNKFGHDYEYGNSDKPEEVINAKGRDFIKIMQNASGATGDIQKLNTEKTKIVAEFNSQMNKLINFTKITSDEKYAAFYTDSLAESIVTDTNTLMKLEEKYNELSVQESNLRDTLNTTGGELKKIIAETPNLTLRDHHVQEIRLKR